MWPTEDGSVVRAALRRLAAQHAVAEREAGAGEASPGGVDED
jgi:hypothetical protein